MLSKLLIVWLVVFILLAAARILRSASISLKRDWNGEKDVYPFTFRHEAIMVARCLSWPIFIFRCGIRQLVQH